MIELRNLASAEKVNAKLGSKSLYGYKQLQYSNIDQGYVEMSVAIHLLRGQRTFAKYKFTIS